MPQVLPQVNAHVLPQVILKIPPARFSSVNAIPGNPNLISRVNSSRSVTWPEDRKAWIGWADQSSARSLNVILTSKSPASSIGPSHRRMSRFRSVSQTQDRSQSVHTPCVRKQNPRVPSRVVVCQTPLTRLLDCGRTSAPGTVGLA
jgi:hypothetical protein